MNTHTGLWAPSRFALVTALLALAALPALAANTLVIQYNANPGPAPDPNTVDANVADPGDQFWGGGLASDSAVNDGGTPAWQTSDSGFSPTYTANVSASHVTEGATDGWKLSWNVKAVLGATGGFGANQGMSLLYLENDLSDLWRLDLGVEADGDQIVQVSSRVGGGVVNFFGPHTAQGDGEVFHLYELVFDPGTSTADLFVDGVEQLSDMAGSGIGNGGLGVQIRWGDGSTSSNADRLANHNLVQFETIPEPSRALLLACGVFGIALRRRR